MTIEPGNGWETRNAAWAEPPFGRPLDDLHTLGGEQATDRDAVRAQHGDVTATC